MIREAQRRNRTTAKQERHKFIPFVNERDNIGNIIKVKNQRKSDMNALKIFQNLKKSTKEYLFDKYFEKRLKRFKQCKDGLDQRDFDYDLQFQKLHSVAQSEPSDENFYLNLKEEIAQKMDNLKKRLKSAKIKPNSSQECSRKGFRITTSAPKQSQINENLFSAISNQSKLMASFVNEGKKYNHFVDNKKINPWKKWYQQKTYEVFPGKNFTIKCLEKSLYD